MKKRIYCITMALCIILCIVFTAGCSKAANSSAALPKVRNNGTAIQWKYSDETDWRDLVLLTELTSAAGENGKNGTDGKDGKDGVNGENGTDGKNGINGKDGINGVDGKDGADGKDGINAKNIEVQRAESYIQWRYEGGEWQNLVSISDITGPAGQNGADGANGKTPEFRVNENTLQWRYAGDEIWLNLYDLTALKGADGRDGADGKNGKDGTNGQNGSDGEDGKTPFIGENGNWWIGEIDTGVKAAGIDGTDGVDGEKGDKGDKGDPGEKGDKGDNGDKGDKGDKGDAGQNGGCAGYFHASNGGTGASFNQPLQLFEDCNSGGLFVWDRTNRTVTLKAGHTYSISFSGSVCISHDMGGWYSVVLKGKQGILKDTLIERYMNDADNSRVWMPFAFNRIYSAGSDIVLQYEFIQLTPGTQLNGAVYNLTIIALD